MFRVYLHDRRHDRRLEDHDDGSVWIDPKDLDGALDEHFQQGHFRPNNGRASVIEAPIVTNPGCLVPLEVRINRSTQEVVIDGEYLQHDLLFKKTQDGWQGPYLTALA